MGNTILITEDFGHYLKILSQYFTGEGFTVYSASTGQETIRLAERHLPDCFLLDYNLGGEETIEPACLFIRSHPRLKSAPILILSGEHEQAERCYASCQADNFIPKGRPLAEIGAAVRRSLRRAGAAAGVIAGGDLALDVVSRLILRPGHPAIELPREQFAFFSLLLEHSPRFVTEEELCRRVSCPGAEPMSRKALNMLAYRLRLKLGPRLARRVKNSRASGWIYLQPRSHKKRTQTPEITALSD